jgi:cytochrome c biogenesis protein CcmG/thiol:disulfide interchange protein DsbE
VTPSRIVPPVALGLALVLIGVRWAARPAAPAAIGQPFPRVALKPLPGIPPLTDATLRGGHATVVNLFASWCVPCRAEAPQLAALRAHGIAVAGIAVRDTPADAARFLAATGTALAAAGADPNDRVQPALASSGLPETWVVDGGGIVRARFRGDLHAADVATVEAAVAAAR